MTVCLLFAVCPLRSVVALRRAVSPTGGAAGLPVRLGPRSEHVSNRELSFRSEWPQARSRKVGDSRSAAGGKCAERLSARTARCGPNFLAVRGACQSPGVLEPVRIDDPEDPRIADYVGLTDPELRRRVETEQGFFIAESPHVVRRLLGS